MATFALICLDKPGSVDLRLASREAHLAYVQDHRDLVRLAGPFLDDEGRMVGSLFLIEAPDEAAARAFHAADPYVLAGLFERSDLRRWRATVGDLP
jgi:uncharacterized protein YciI